MGKVTLGLILASVLVTICLVYLTRSGVSLRPATLIKPTVIKTEQNVTDAVVNRLFPEFKENDTLLIGLPPNKQAAEFLNLLQESYKKHFKKEARIVNGPEELKECKEACWLPLPPSSAHALRTNAFIEDQIKPLDRSYFTMTLFQFSTQEKLPKRCRQQQRLSLTCIRTLSVAEFKRKMSEDQKYFFMRKYLDKNVFVFMQN